MLPPWLILPLDNLFFVGTQFIISLQLKVSPPKRGMHLSLRHILNCSPFCCFCLFSFFFFSQTKRLFFLFQVFFLHNSKQQCLRLCPHHKCMKGYTCPRNRTDSQISFFSFFLFFYISSFLLLYTLQCSFTWLKTICVFIFSTKLASMPAQYETKTVSAGCFGSGFASLKYFLFFTNFALTVTEKCGHLSPWQIRIMRRVYHSAKWFTTKECVLFERLV